MADSPDASPTMTNGETTYTRSKCTRVSRYKYSPIPNGSHTRWFDLSPGSWDDPIRGHLSVQLDREDNFYEAVSYTWGSDHTTTVIDCDGDGLNVRPNLAILLRRFRSPTDTKRLWVDALCINQSDKCEQSEQVRRMDSVYRNATRVTIWLGEETGSTAEAFDLLEELRKSTRLPSHETSSSMTYTYDTLSVSTLPRHDEKRWRALERLLNNSWFSRTWVLQEATLNTCTWIHQGGHSVEWSLLRFIIMGLCSEKLNVLYHINLTASLYMAHFCASLQSDASNWPLLGLLETTEWTLSSQAVDKVFGLVGLASDWQTVKHLVDYRYDAPTLYRKVALTYLLAGNMKMLHSASDHSFAQYRHLPTWVPDWSTCSRTSSLGTLFSTHGLPPPTKPKRLPTVSSDGFRLTVSGQFTDRVAAIGRHLPVLRYSYRAIGFMFLESWRRLAHKHLGHSAHPAMPMRTDVEHTDPLDEAFARLLTIDCPLEVLASESYTSTYSWFLEQSLRCRQQGAWRMPYEREDVFKFCDRMLSSCRKRTFFVTEQGRMGLGPFFLRPGDRMVQLDGGWTPMAVRSRADGCFELVGEAYVPGLMKGGWEDEAVYEDICLV
ncbi:hypothetical protein LTR01_008933 [Friedmanniomyces endolithicus]|nr:hypothetical protein LTR01_008933 [Friedmanniomyces endolithicus]